MGGPLNILKKSKLNTPPALSLKHGSLINIALPEIPQAVFDRIGNFQAGHLETVAIRFRLVEHWAQHVPPIKIVESL